jgi:pimeloyl-ACP methyl ester carboxylesterase
MRVLLSGVLLALSAISAEDHYFDSAGVRLRYIVEGVGEPVVLIHGFGSNVELGWGETGIIKGLTGRYQVVALDLRGHGRSGKPHTREAYGFPMAEDVVRLMDRLRIQRAHVAGYSMGGRIVAMLLAERPARLRSAIIAGAGWEDGQRLQARHIRMERAARSLEQGQGIGPLLEWHAPPSAGPPAPQEVEAFNKVFLARNDPIALAAVARGFTGLQPSESKLRANRTPALALVGELDPNQPDAIKLAAITRNLKVVIIRGANHRNAVRNPEFLENLRAFLASQANR